MKKLGSHCLLAEGLWEPWLTYAAGKCGGHHLKGEDSCSKNPLLRNPFSASSLIQKSVS